MSQLRKIAVVTTSRADFGLQRWLIKSLQANPKVDLLLFAGGMHLLKEYGHTIDEVKDEFPVTEEIDFLDASPSKLEACFSLAKAINGFARAFEQHKPDLISVLGDRYELLAPVNSATILNIPIAHIHGGELTTGVIDDAVRHAVTKMSHLHFASEKEYADRIIQMGELKERVFNFGAPGLDQIFHLDPVSKKNLSDELGFPLDKFFIVTHHPLTLDQDAIQETKNLISSLKSFLPQYKLLITGTNADPKGADIWKLISDFAKDNSDHVKTVESLGSHRYLSALRYASVCIGNSSSGIYEAPAVKTPTVNIGPRQDGRFRPDSIIDVTSDDEAIKTGIKNALTYSFDKDSSKYDGKISQRIANTMSEFPLENLLTKTFHNLK